MAIVFFEKTINERKIMCFRPAAVELDKTCPKCGATCKAADISCPKCGAELPSGFAIPGAPGAPKAPGAPNNK